MTNTSQTGGLILPNPPPAPQPLEDADLVNLFQQLISGVGNVDPTLVRPRWQVQPPSQPDNATTWVSVGIHNRTADTYPWVGHANQLIGILAGGELTGVQQLIGYWAIITNGGFKISVNGAASVEITGLNFSSVATLFEVASIIEGAINIAQPGVIYLRVFFNDGQFVFTTYNGATPSIAALTSPTTAGVTDISGQLLCTAGTLMTTFTGTLTSDELQRHEQLEVICSFYGPLADTTAALVRDGLMIAQNRAPLTLGGFALVAIEDTRNRSQFLNNQWYYRLDMPIFLNRAIVREYPINNLLTAVATLISNSGQTQTVSVHQ